MSVPAEAEALDAIAAVLRDRAPGPGALDMIRAVVAGTGRDVPSVGRFLDLSTGHLPQAVLLGLGMSPASWPIPHRSAHGCGCRPTSRSRPPGIRRRLRSWSSRPTPGRSVVTGCASTRMPPPSPPCQPSSGSDLTQPGPGPVRYDAAPGLWRGGTGTRDTGGRGRGGRRCRAPNWAAAPTATSANPTGLRIRRFGVRVRAAPRQARSVRVGRGGGARCRRAAVGRLGLERPYRPSPRSRSGRCRRW